MARRPPFHLHFSGGCRQQSTWLLLRLPYLLYNVIMFGKILSGIGVLAVVALLYIVNTTTPTQAGALGVLAVFLLSYIVIVAVLAFFLYGVHMVIMKAFYSDRLGKITDDFTLKRAYYFASVLALGPVIFVSLRSVGKVGVGELFMVVILLVLGSVYVSRQTS